MPRDSAAADRPASYLVGTAAAFPLLFRDRTKPINKLPFSTSAKFPKSGSSCESRVSISTDRLNIFLQLGQEVENFPNPSIDLSISFGLQVVPDSFSILGHRRIVPVAEVINVD